MMNKSRIHFKFKFLTGTIFFIWTGGCFAQSAPDAAAVSLMNLKKSVQELKSKNDTLVTENEALKNDLQRLESERAYLMKIRENRTFEMKASPEVRPARQSLNVYQRQLQDELDYLTRQEQDLTRRLQGKIADEHQLKTEFRDLQEAIRKTEAKLKELDLKQARVFQQKHGHVLESIQKSEGDLRQTEQRIRRIRAENADGLKEIEAVKSKQKILKQELTIAEDEFRITAEEEKKLTETLEKTKNHIQQRKLELTREISQLKLRRQKLEETLFQANLKLEDKNVTQSFGNQDLSRLQKNYVLMRDINQSLKDKRASLKRKLEKTE